MHFPYLVYTNKQIYVFPSRSVFLLIRFFSYLLFLLKLFCAVAKRKDIKLMLSYLFFLVSKLYKKTLQYQKKDALICLDNLFYLFSLISYIRLFFFFYEHTNYLNMYVNTILLQCRMPTLILNWQFHLLTILTNQN